MKEQFMSKSNGYTAGSLFAGIGGVCRGFKDAGFDVLWANEFDSKANETYRVNFEHYLNSLDIHDLNPSDFKKVDVLTSGFPCQAFSIAGYRHGFNDVRGNLFFETLKFINILQPKAFLLENVKNLISHDKGKTFQIIKEAILDSGYSFMPMVLNSMNYGNVPQTRERVYIVGFCGESEYNINNDKGVCSSRFKFPKKIKLTKSIRDILEKSKVDERYYYKKSCKFYKELKDGMKSRDTVYQWRRIYLRENKSNVCPTLTANMGTGGHNVPLVLDDYGIRKLTPRECARLQGFKESFNLPYDKVCNSQLYKQLGNSVSVPVVRRVASQIQAVLDVKYGGKKIENKKEKLEFELAVS